MPLNQTKLTNLKWLALTLFVSEIKVFNGK